MASLPCQVLKRASRLAADAIQHRARGFHHKPSRTLGFIVAEAQKGVDHLTRSEIESTPHGHPLPTGVSPSNDILPTISGRRRPVGRVRTSEEIIDVPSLYILSRLHVEARPKPKFPWMSVSRSENNEPGHRHGRLHFLARPPTPRTWPPLDCVVVSQRRLASGAPSKTMEAGAPGLHLPCRLSRLLMRRGLWRTRARESARGRMSLGHLDRNWRLIGTAAQEDQSDGGTWEMTLPEIARELPWWLGGGPFWP